jgi:hypothetical protein
MRPFFLQNFGFLLMVMNSFTGLNSEWSWAEVAKAESVKIQGQVERFAFSPDGKPSGLVLSDHTLINFDPESLSHAETLSAGNSVSVVGRVIRSKPNSVLDHGVIKKGNQVLVDESASRENPPAAPDFASRKQMEFRSDSSTLFAVGAKENGEVDRLILKDGTTVQLPPGGFLDPSKLKLGEKVAVEGVGKKFEKGAFIDALGLENENRANLLSRRGEHGEYWRSKQGTIQQALVTPQGYVDGLLLTDQSVIRFPRARLDSLQPLLKQGTPVWVAGPTLLNETQTQRILLTQQNQMLDFTVPRSAGEAQPTGQVSLGEGASTSTTASSLPLQDEAEVQTIVKGPTGEIDSLILADGVSVKIPPDQRNQLPANLKQGDLISVQGRGGKYPLGTAIEASSIQVTNFG